MPSPETQRMIEIAAKETRWLHSLVELKDVENCLINILTQDRQHIHTSLVAAVEDIKDHSKRCSAGNYRDGMLSVCDQVLTIINSIFKE